MAGAAETFTIVARDRFDNVKSDTGDTFTVQYSNTNPFTTDVRLLLCEPTSMVDRGACVTQSALASNGQYPISVSNTLAGTHDLFVRFGTNSPRTSR